MLQTAFRPSCMNRASVFEWHKRFNEDRESVRDDERCGRSKEVNTPEFIGLGLLCWGFKGVQEEIPSEEASTLQIGSATFPPGQCTSPQIHHCHRLFDQDGHCDEGHWHAHTRGLPWGLPEVIGTVQQLHCIRRRLLRRGLEFHVCTINKSAHTKKSLETYLMILVLYFHNKYFIVAMAFFLYCINWTSFIAKNVLSMYWILSMSGIW